MTSARADCRTSLSPLEHLLAEQACRHFVLASVEAVESQHHGAFTHRFTPEGVLIRPDGQRLEGRAAIEQAYAQRDPNRHLITKHRLTLNGSAQASSRCSVLLWSGRHSDVAGPQWQAHRRGAMAGGVSR